MGLSGWMGVDERFVISIRYEVPISTVVGGFEDGLEGRLLDS